MYYQKARDLANFIRKHPPSRRYLAYIFSPQWKLVRNQHLERNGYRCEICHKAKACQVHHFTYDRLGFELPRDLCAVCVQCHHDIHAQLIPVPANDNQLQLPLEAS